MMDKKPISEDKRIRAVGLEEIVAYRPAARPGYTAWVNLFPDQSGRLLLSFLEVKREKNPNFQACPLEFSEAMFLVLKEGPDLLGKSTPDFVFEYPVLLSDDGGRQWKEVGRSRVFDRHFWYCSLPDGSLLRSHAVNSYRYDLGRKRFRSPISRSVDGGTTWKEISSVTDDAFFYVQRLRLLKDHTLIVLGSILDTFGPDGESPQRLTLPIGAERIAMGAFFLSRDFGKTWSPPQTVVPGETCWEPDFVELPSGDLLFINSTVQAPRNTRQYYRRRGNRYLPGPVLKIEAEPHFIVPETVTILPDGLIIGANRDRCVAGSGTYTYSNDEGATWHVIDGLPRCQYQPMIQTLKDGRIACASHLGADTRFGEFDMYVLLHTFGLEGRPPNPARLSITRRLDRAGGQYINAFSSVLTSDGRPLAGRAVEFRVLDRVSREDYRDVRESKDVFTNGKVYLTVSDADGLASVKLPEYDRVIDVDICYMVQSFFRPVEGDEAAACFSEVYSAYAVTPARNNPNNYPAYLRGGVLWVEPSLLDTFPEIEGLVREFSGQGIEVLSADEAARKLGVSPERAKEVIGVFRRNNVLLDEAGGRYRWNPIRQWSSPNNPVLISEVRKICVLDHYI